MPRVLDGIVLTSFGGTIPGNAWL